MPGAGLWPRLSREGREKTGLRLCSQLSTRLPDPRPKHNGGFGHLNTPWLRCSGRRPRPCRAPPHGGSRRGLPGPEDLRSAAGIGGLGPKVSPPRRRVLTRAVPAGRPLPAAGAGPSSELGPGRQGSSPGRGQRQALPPGCPPGPGPARPAGLGPLSPSPTSIS